MMTAAKDQGPVDVTKQKDTNEEAAQMETSAEARRVCGVKAEARLDLRRYAGTYGGTVEAQPRTAWQRFKTWLERHRVIIGRRL